jgi:hypothetical protein
VACVEDEHDRERRGGEDTFSFNFFIPVLISGPTEVSASVSGTLTDATGDEGSLIPPSDSDGDSIDEILSGSAFDGVSFLNLGVDVGPAAERFRLFPYGPFSDGPQAGPSGSFSILHATLSFTLSGNGDSASFSGFVTLEPAAVPEPGAFWPVVAGLGVVALGSRRIR